MRGRKYDLPHIKARKLAEQELRGFPGRRPGDRLPVRMIGDRQETPAERRTRLMQIARGEIIETVD